MLDNFESLHLPTAERTALENAGIRTCNDLEASTLLDIVAVVGAGSGLGAVVWAMYVVDLSMRASTEPVPPIRIADLDLEEKLMRSRTQQALERDGAATLHDLVIRTESQVRNAPNSGIQSLGEVNRLLSTVGLSLAA